MESNSVQPSPQSIPAENQPILADKDTADKDTIETEQTNTYHVRLKSPAKNSIPGATGKQTQTKQDGIPLAQSKKQQQIGTNQQVGGQKADITSKLHSAKTETQSLMPPRQYFSSVANPHPVDVNDFPTTPQASNAQSPATKFNATFVPNNNTPKDKHTYYKNQCKQAIEALNEDPRFQGPVEEQFIESLTTMNQYALKIYQKDHPKYEQFAKKLLENVNDAQFGSRFESQYLPTMIKRYEEGRNFRDGRQQQLQKRQKESKEKETELAMREWSTQERLESAKKQRDIAKQQLEKLQPGQHLVSESEDTENMLSSLWKQEGDLENKSGVDRSSQHLDRNQANERYRQAENKVKTIENELQPIQEEHKRVQEEHERVKARHELEALFSKIVRGIDRSYRDWDTDNGPPPSIDDRVIDLHGSLYSLKDSDGNWDKKSKYYRSVTKLPEAAHEELKKIDDEAADYESTNLQIEKLSTQVEERYSVDKRVKKENEQHLLTDLENLMQLAGCAPAES